MYTPSQTRSTGEEVEEDEKKSRPAFGEGRRRGAIWGLLVFLDDLCGWRGGVSLKSVGGCEEGVRRKSSQVKDED